MQLVVLADERPMISHPHDDMDVCVCVCVLTQDAKLTEAMGTRLIMRTNFRKGDPGFMPDTAWEISHFKFTPAP